MLPGLDKDDGLNAETLNLRSRLGVDDASDLREVPYPALLAAVNAEDESGQSFASPRSLRRGHALALSGIQAGAESIAVPKTAMKAMAVIQTYRPSKRDASSE